MKAELVPTEGSAPIPITRDITVVGRREYCDVQIDHPSVSKRHCVLVRTDGLLVIRDLATTNGTKVNGQKVMWAALLPNDRVALGRCKFKVYLGGDDAPSPSERWVPKAAEPVAMVSSARAVGAIPRPEEATVGFASPTPLTGPAVNVSAEDVPEFIEVPDLILDEDNSDELEILDD